MLVVIFLKNSQIAASRLVLRRDNVALSTMALGAYNYELVQTRANKEDTSTLGLGAKVSIFIFSTRTLNIPP